jgi:protein arginine N-methyltransferase 3
LPQEITAEHLADDKLLIPVLEDDALIFCLDELPASAPSPAREQGKAAEAPAAAGHGEAPVDELLQKNAQLQAELEQLAKQFTNYRLAVEQTLDKRWGVDEEGETAESSKAAAPVAPEKKQKDESTYYFESYAHNGKLTPLQLYYKHI